MVDVSYQMVLSTLQTVGLLVGIYYYVTVLRNQQKSQKQSEDTRKIQLLMQIHQAQNVEYAHRRADVANLDLSEYDDFMVESDRALWSKVSVTLAEWNQLGLLLKYGFVDHDMMFEFLHGRGPIVHWNKYESFVMDLRQKHGLYSYCVGFEYLASEMIKYRDKQGQMLQNQPPNR